MIGPRCADAHDGPELELVHPKAAYMTASEYDHALTRRFVADFREESIYWMLACDAPR
jgi:hypothetical protein